MSKFDTSTDTIKKSLANINLPNTISSDINFKLDASVQDKIIDLINEEE